MRPFFKRWIWPSIAKPPGQQNGRGPRHGPPPKAARLLTALLAPAAALLAACAPLGPPSLPQDWGWPPAPQGHLFVVYRPASVLGFGHTGLMARLAAQDGPPVWIRFDQYASSELAHQAQLAQGAARFYHGLTHRLPPLLGLTRESILVERAETPQQLLRHDEWLIPLAATPAQAGAVAQAGLERAATAQGLEAPTARTYWLSHNNCQHFANQLLAQGGLPPLEYFPLHMAQRLARAHRLAAFKKPPGPLTPLAAP